MKNFNYFLNMCKELLEQKNLIFQGVIIVSEQPSGSPFKEYCVKRSLF